MNKRRITNEQDQGNLGESDLDRHFRRLMKWQPRPLTPDLGEDLIIDIYDDGVSAGLAFYAQVKSSEDVSKFKLEDGTYSYGIKTKDIEHWRDYFPPVVLFLWDTTLQGGYWVTVSELIRSLDSDNAGWAGKVDVKVHIPKTNTTGKDDLVRLRRAIASQLQPAFAANKPFSMNLTLTYPKGDPNALKEQEAVRRFLAKGEEVSISGQYIESIEFPEWHRRKFGDVQVNPTDIFTFGPRHSEIIEKLRLTVLSPKGRILRNQLIEVKAVQAGDEEITFSNKHHPSPFTFQMVLRGGHVHITVSLQGSKATPKESIDAYYFLEAAAKAGLMRVEALTRTESWGDYQKFEIPFSPDNFPQMSEAFFHLLGKLCLIEEKTGVNFLLTDEGIKQDDWQWIQNVATIVTTGELTRRIPPHSVNVSGGTSPDTSEVTVRYMLKSWREGAPIGYQVEREDTSITLLGVSIPFGSSTRRVSGPLTKQCAKRFERYEKSGKYPKKLKISLGESVQEDEFPEWREIPEALAQEESGY